MGGRLQVDNYNDLKNVCWYSQTMLTWELQPDNPVYWDSTADILVEYRY